jgi:hypothetical protein
MTQKLIDKLIAHYEWCVKEIEGMEDYCKIFEFAMENNVCQGICMCASEEFDVSIYNDKWVKSFKTDTNYWTDCPLYVDNKQRTISALQFRIDRMKTFKP